MNNPTPLPAFFNPKPTSEIAREAKRLHDTATALRAQVAAIGQEGRDMYDDFLAAKHALAAEQAKPERNPEELLVLAEKVKLAEILADPIPFRVRTNQAAGESEAAVQRYRSWVREHGPELLRELEPAAIDTTEKLAGAEAKLEPLRVARAAVAANVKALTDTFHNGNGDHAAAWAVPGDPAEVPFPRAEVVAWLANELAPAPVETELTPAIAVDDGRTWR